LLGCYPSCRLTNLASRSCSPETAGRAGLELHWGNSASPYAVFGISRAALNCPSDSGHWNGRVLRSYFRPTQWDRNGRRSSAREAGPGTGQPLLGDRASATGAIRTFHKPSELQPVDPKPSDPMLRLLLCFSSLVIRSRCRKTSPSQDCWFGLY